MTMGAVCTWCSSWLLFKSLLLRSFCLSDSLPVRLPIRLITRLTRASVGPYPNGKHYFQIGKWKRNLQITSQFWERKLVLFYFLLNIGNWNLKYISTSLLIWNNKSSVHQFWCGNCSAALNNLSGYWVHIMHWVSLSFSLSVCLAVYWTGHHQDFLQTVWLSYCVTIYWLSDRLSDYLTVFLTIYRLSDCLSVWLFTDCLTVCLTIWPSFWLSTDCLTVWLSICVTVYWSQGIISPVYQLSVYLSIYLSIFGIFWLSNKS